MAEIPERLKANGRAEDPVFLAAERLFRRYKWGDYSEGQFSNVVLPLSAPMSVNREKYSQPEDVLLSENDEYIGMGVFFFSVQDLPVEVTPEEPAYTTLPQHVPVENNYSHSEVWCNRLRVAGPHVVPNKRAKKFIRAYLSQRIQIEIPAQDLTDGK